MSLRIDQVHRCYLGASLLEMQTLDPRPHLRNEDLPFNGNLGPAQAHLTLRSSGPGHPFPFLAVRWDQLESF